MKVWLMHESGKRYGPFDRTADSLGAVGFDLPTQSIRNDAIKLLGFTIELVEPEEITITQNQLNRAMYENKVRMDNVGFGDLWSILCKLSGTK